jgi:hypothetical protein
LSYQIGQSRLSLRQPLVHLSLEIAGMLQARSNMRKRWRAALAPRRVCLVPSKPQSHNSLREGDTLVRWPVRHAGAKML